MSLPSPWSEDFYTDEIQHYGVKGMKWGGVINEKLSKLGGRIKLKWPPIILPYIEI